MAFLGAFSTAILFALFTHLAWDDWYITYRASKNLALGNGLTFTPGERIHSFTSPAGTLVPALLSYLVGNVHDDWVLWLFRILNAALLGFAAVLTISLAERFGMRRWSIIFLIVTAFIEVKLLANAMNGMETAMLLLSLIATIYALVLPSSLRSTILLGIGWAGLMWSRPDGIVDIVALAVGYVAFAMDGGWRGRLECLRRFIPAGLILLLLYGGWPLWAHFYYGSFVPHTIIAKGLSRPHLFGTLDLTTLRHVAHFFLVRTLNWPGTLMPPYSITMTGWPWLLVNFSRWLSFLTAFAWIVPHLRRTTRFLSLSLFLLQAYLELGMEFTFPWYFAPASFLTIFVCALILDQLATARASETTAPRAAAAAGIVIALLTATITLLGTVQLRAFQRVIYDGNYRLVGLWLRDHARDSHDTVFLEPLGYISFFSGLKMYDYPGLSSEEVIRARRMFPIQDLGSRAIFADLIPVLQPKWLVLRPKEVALINAAKPELLAHDYQLAQTFDVTPAVDRLHVPGVPWFRYEQTFTVYRRAGAI